MKLSMIKFNFLSVILVLFSWFVFHIDNSFAGLSYSPSQVFSGVEYSNQIVSKILRNKGISDIQIPVSKETAAKPMHVYELHISVLQEIYFYALKNNLRPPPMVVSTPIQYTPTDVYFITQLVMKNIEEIYRASGGTVIFSMTVFNNKSPVDVYQELFELYYKVNRLNGKSKVSPSEVFSHIYRAKEDLQSSLLILSKRLPDAEQQKKRLLVSAIYGMHTNGLSMAASVPGKNPGEVIEKAFEVRDRLNLLRQFYKLPTIKHPQRNNYNAVKPIDVFLQTQFIIAELNLLKKPMVVERSTVKAKGFSNKTPSDVFYEMQHLVYMLDRLLQVL